MKATHLRIGNNIYDSLRDKIIQIELKHFRELAISEVSFFARYKPIEINLINLSEISINKYNSDKTSEYKLLENKGFEIVHKKDDNLFILFWDKKKTKVIKYINELQNIYFALTGEELTLKP